MTDQLMLFAPPSDNAARAAVASDLARTMFVEAGAGTGKTKVLVDRVVALITNDGDELPVPVSAIAAITFTEKAAAELRDRIRTELRRRVDDVTDTPAARTRCAQALDDLDAAAICTLHSFAQRMLTEFPIEAGLPPRIEVRDEISSRIAFDARWRVFVDQMLDDPGLESTLLALLAAGVKFPHLRTVAEVLDDNWDLLDRIGAAPPLPDLGVDAWLARLDAVCCAAEHCRDSGDNLFVRLAELREYADGLRNAVDEAQRIEILMASKPSFAVGNTGRKGNWPDISGVRDDVVRLGEQRKELTDAVIDVAIRRAVAAIKVYVADAVAQRRVSGDLDFHDLLVLARTLLRDPEHGPRARARLRARYRRILIDEFQDTDPIQVELAALLGSSDDEAGSQPWDRVEVDPGRLFFVGDPKQSIYRFRRADIATFLAARDRFARPAPQFLECNFRTAPRVLSWVNHVFGELIQPYEASQPEYRPLEAGRPVPAEHDRDVVLLGVDAHDEPGIDAAGLRAREAADVAGIVTAAVANAWTIYDTKTEEWRPARLGDICILIPARTSLGYLELALTEAGIPYRAESSSLVYSSREIRDLLMTLRAVDDPTDELALVSALRSSVFGCGDDDLFAFHVEHDGRWNLAAPLPATLSDDDCVAEAMGFLAELHAARHWSTPSELLERVVRERGVIETGALTGRFRDVARRVRFVVDQARAYSDAAGGTLRDYLGWAELQGAEGARVVEAVLPETDDDAVRIMTIHGAKGLEFPIVVCSGMTTAAQSAARSVEVLFPAAGGCEVKIVKGVQTAEFELHKPIDEQMGFHEKLRLLYVAATRARDHLVVSVHRKARTLDPSERPKWTHAELVWEAAQDAPWVTPGAAPLGRAVHSTVPIAPVEPGLEPGVWQAEYERLHRRSERRTFVSATTLAHRLDGAEAARAAEGAGDPGLAKQPRDLELPPWNKGRYGTAIGRAVHGTLQTVDLERGDGVEATAAAQAAAEGVLGHEATIEALTRAALGSPIVMRSAARPHWRETYVAVPFEGITLEGYVDLVFRDDDGLVIVDYKTDAVDPETRAGRVVQYRIQAASYALAVAEATGEPVVRAVLCFLERGGATEVTFTGGDLESAVEEVRALLAAERDDPSPRLPALPTDA
jgi:ATP-dependent exoDNAse (exonuclease V) beta subunit